MEINTNIVSTIKRSDYLKLTSVSDYKTGQFYNVYNKEIAKKVKDCYLMYKDPDLFIYPIYLKISNKVKGIIEYKSMIELDNDFLGYAIFKLHMHLKSYYNYVWDELGLSDSFEYVRESEVYNRCYSSDVTRVILSYSKGQDEIHEEFNNINNNLLRLYETTDISALWSSVSKDYFIGLPNQDKITIRIHTHETNSSGCDILDIMFFIKDYYVDLNKLRSSLISISTNLDKKFDFLKCFNDKLNIYTNKMLTNSGSV